MEGYPMKNLKISFLALTAVIALVTLFVRVPLPSRGYFNFGDVAVVFSGLVLGSLGSGKGVVWGAAAGGIGSAIADIIGGFGMFAPITLIAKGAEGAFAALASGRSRSVHWLFLALGGAAMVGVYFLIEILLPNIGLQGALSEIVPNLIQAVGGVIGGRITHAAFSRIIGHHAPMDA
jgi:uncharacterized membrane protein